MNKSEILSRTTPEQDTLMDSPEKSLRWTELSNQMFPYEHPRPLPNKVAQKAIEYIDAIVKEYPFQLRFHMATPLWERFADEWCATGDEGKALRGI